jgi:hypothetical protein
VCIAPTRFLVQLSEEEFDHGMRRLSDYIAIRQKNRVGIGRLFCLSQKQI